MSVPLVKMCGFTRPEDALIAVREGASLIGMIFAEESVRRVDEEAAGRIAESVRSFSDDVSLVGVFVNEPASRINDLTRRFGLDLVQLHGEEEERFPSELEAPVIRAVRVREGVNLEPGGEYEWLLYDAWAESTRGGTGNTFDWSLLDARSNRKKRMLSGGLNSENVREAILRVEPDAVDVASGIESAPGIKDPQKIERFMTEVKNG